MKKYLKKSVTSLLLVAIFVVTNIAGISAAAAPIKFTDVKSTSWYYNYVNRLVDLKITAGVGNNRFGPNSDLTRAEFVTFLCKATGLVQLQGYDFDDTKNHWAKGWITAAVTTNIIDKGTSFLPNKAITRQEVVEMLCRSLNLSADTAMQTPYDDVKTDPGYSNTAFKEYLMLGSIDKDKRYFKPVTNITRAETASVLCNMVDYISNPAGFKVAKKAELDKKNDAEKYAAWQESVKGISSELLANTEGLVKPSLYESYKYLKTETDYFKVWGAQYGINENEFAKEMVRVGTKYGNTWANADYRKLVELEINLKSLWEKNVINNFLKRNLDYTKNNTLVSEGNFITSTGMLVFADFGNPVLRGTMKYKYSSPTSSNLLNSEIVGSTGKASQLDTWYEQDYEIHFLPEKDGLKITSMNSISDIRIAK